VKVPTSLTLWRGDQLVGELLLRSPAHQPRHREGKPPSLAAFLVRDPDAPRCEGVWQFAPPVPGVGVQQRPVEPDIGRNAITARARYEKRLPTRSWMELCGPFSLPLCLSSMHQLPNERGS